MRPDEAMLPYRLPRTAVRQEGTNGFIEGEVHSVGPAGMKFTVKAWDAGKHVFGPAPWPGHVTALGEPGLEEHTHDPAVPTPGARVLVLFLGEGIERPWVLGWWPA